MNPTGAGRQVPPGAQTPAIRTSSLPSASGSQPHTSRASQHQIQQQPQQQQQHPHFQPQVNVAGAATQSQNPQVGNQQVRCLQHQIIPSDLISDFLRKDPLCVRGANLRTNRTVFPDADPTNVCPKNITNTLTSCFLANFLLFCCCLSLFFSCVRFRLDDIIRTAISRIQIRS